jgi:hypothetical protein
MACGPFLPHLITIFAQSGTLSQGRQDGGWETGDGRGAVKSHRKEKTRLGATQEDERSYCNTNDILTTYHPDLPALTFQ